MGSSNEEVETAAANNLNQDGDSNPSTEIQQVENQETSQELNGTRGETPLKKVPKMGIGRWLISKFKRQTPRSETDPVPDVEVDGPVLLTGEVQPDPETVLFSSGSNINMKKTAANGLMDFAFLTANANQLNQATHWPASSTQALIISLISLSIALQIVAGVLLIFTSYFQSQPPFEIADANSPEARLARAKKRARTRWLILMDHFGISIFLFIAIINLFITAFSSGSQQTSTSTPPKV